MFGFVPFCEEHVCLGVLGELLCIGVVCSNSSYCLMKDKLTRTIPSPYIGVGLICNSTSETFIHRFIYNDNMIYSICIYISTYSICICSFIFTHTHTTSYI